MDGPVRWLGVRLALLVSLVSIGLVQGSATGLASRLPRTSCTLPHTLTVPGGAPQALAFDPVARLLLVATRSGLTLMDSCTGTVESRLAAGGIPSLVAVDAAARRALVLVAQQRVRLLDTHTRRWLGLVRLPADALPEQLAVAGGTHVALVLSRRHATLWVVDTRTGSVQHHVAGLPGTQEAVAMDAGRQRAFVANAGRGSNNVSVIDTRRWRVVQTTAVGSWPLAVVVSTRTGHVFVASRDSRSVSMLDARTGHVLRTVKVAGTPHALAVDEQRGTVYVAVRASGKGHLGQLVVLNAATGSAARGQSIRVPAGTLTVDPQTGTVFDLDPSTSMIMVLPATTASRTAPTGTLTRTPIRTATSTPVATPTLIGLTLEPVSPAPGTAGRTPTSTSTSTSSPTPRPTVGFTPIATFTPTPTPSYSPLPTTTPTPSATSTPVASIVVTPTSGAIGGTATVSGQGFGSTQQITVSLEYVGQGLDNLEVPGTAQVIATTDATGAFTGHFTVMSSVNALIPGTYTLAARSGQPGPLARVPFTVTAAVGAQLAGRWVNPNPTVNHISHVLILLHSDGYYWIRVYQWGTCNPTECAWGEAPLSLTSSTTASATYATSVQAITLTISMIGAQLQVDAFYHFTDGSGLPDQHITDYLDFSPCTATTCS
jgi:YVTN family beta-propeller protein